MRHENIAMLQDTLDILEQKEYILDGERIELKLSQEEMRKIEVYLPGEIQKISEAGNSSQMQHFRRMRTSCENRDSFSLAIEKTKEAGMLSVKTKKPVLVLNLANPVNPGGGVRRGAIAQEEDLCRKSSLLLSLESQEAAAYYNYNKALHTYMGSDAVMITPQVEIIKDERGNLLTESVIVSVMTCAAPMVTRGMEGLTNEEYQDMVYHRICGMLKVAAHLGFERLVLGAFGCGAFGNDAHVISDLFFQALKEFRFDGKRAEDYFRRVDFAVLDLTAQKYNFREFSRNFENYYRHEDERKRNQIRGCLIGGAIGDALGYTVEFLDEDTIFRNYGKGGITEYALTDGKAVISDDTQMTLFTANGILVGSTRRRIRGIGAEPRFYVADAYQDWLKTQQLNIDALSRHDGCTKENRYSWLLDVPELYALRAPGNTCISALQKLKLTGYKGNGIKNPMNQSKGCGGVMRTAPLALAYRPGENYYGSQASLDKEAAEIAAITHGHSLGYMPSAVLNHIISRILTARSDMTLKEMILDAAETAEEIFAGDSFLPELIDIIHLAVHLSENNERDIDNIHFLGEGWVAEETLGIAIYCALKYQDDFSKAIITSVNHNGDSDSTGAVTGNILGAWAGYEAIDEKWNKDLELFDVILEMADDLCDGCRMSEPSCSEDPAWFTKYMKMHRYQVPDAKPSCIFFWRDDEKNGEFSNWYIRKFVIDDYQYFCVEQYMMAQKAKLFHDAERYTAILRANTPAGCKALGKQVKPFSAEEWDAVKYDIVKRANRAKYMQNPDLMRLLLSTEDSILAEASPKDTVWGIGLTAAAAEKTDPSEWPGENLLGKILMELRDEFRRKMKE